MAAVAGAFAFGGVAPAEASTVGDCTIEALIPSKEVPPNPYNGPNPDYWAASAKASLQCSTVHRVEAELQLYGDDPIFDDRLGAVSRLTIGGGPTFVRLGGSLRPCDEDPYGAPDDIYSKARARIETDGVWSAWSAWDRGTTRRVICNVKNG